MIGNEKGKKDRGMVPAGTRGHREAALASATQHFILVTSNAMPLLRLPLSPSKNIVKSQHEDRRSCDLRIYQKTAWTSEKTGYDSFASLFIEHNFQVIQRSSDDL